MSFKIDYNKIHKIHLWTDLSIGIIALVGLFIKDILHAWYALDLTFHIAIFVLATGMIAAERLVKHGKHASEVMGKGLHRVHLIADLSISSMAVIGLLFEEVLEAFFEVDIVFHIAIFVLAIGGIIAEKLIFKHKHPGIIGV